MKRPMYETEIVMTWTLNSLVLNQFVFHENRLFLRFTYGEQINRRKTIYTIVVKVFEMV